MTSARRRGAHAGARPRPAPKAVPFVAAKRAPQPAVGGRAPSKGGTWGNLLSGLRSWITLLRVVVAALVVGFIVAGVGDGWWSSPSAEPTVQSFLLDWQEHDWAAAAALTTGKPAAVAAELQSAYRQLDSAGFSLSMAPITQGRDSAIGHFQSSVDLGQEAEPWVYEGVFRLRLTGSTWKIVWSPSVISPGLRRGLHLAMLSTTPRRMPLLDAEGHSLQTPSTAVLLGVQPGRLANPSATAQALGRVTGIDPTEMLGWIMAAPRRPFLELVTLKPAQYHRMARALRRVPGLMVRHRQVRLFTSTAPAVVGSVGTEDSGILRTEGIAYRPGATVGLSGLQQHYQNYLAGTPTTEVVAETSTGHVVSVLQRWQGQRPTAVRTTIDATVQAAAAHAVAAARGSAAVIAVQASTGHILADAEHAAAGMRGIDSLDGKYPPGGAFTIVSTEALLESGLAVNAPDPCGSVNSVGGRNFRNVPEEPDAGTRWTFAMDFARSCGTAFSGLSLRLTSADLENAAKGFGLGQPWQLPLPGYSGEVQAAGGAAQLAAATMGQGNVQVSPLTMAEVAAQVDTGVWHEPSLVTKPLDPVRSRQLGFAAGTMDSLRSLMRDAVTSGAAQRADVPGPAVYGQVGTAPLGAGKHQKWATWFVGYRGNIAFAILEISRSSRVSATPVAADFLRAAPAR
jgi:Penicillin binding protein transpeptidase domain/Penicillin-binding Protein dimerisation domain